MGTGLAAGRGRLRYRLGWMLRKHYATWLALVVARNEYRHLLVRNSSAFLIDGYYRSANTFSVEAFLSVNPSVAVVHHLHSPFQFLRSARFDVPAVLLIRRPEDAIASELVRTPERSAADALDEWIFFYRTTRCVADKVVVATFEEVTSEFSRVIHRVNRMFGRSFAEYQNSPAADAVAFGAVDEYFRTGRGRDFSAEKFGQVVGRPNPARSDELNAARSRIVGPSKSALSEAQALFADYLAVVERQCAHL